ncbi:MAG: cobalamin-binding protein [Candidatus Lokiarchaeota archaeon]|nr:cobalamin-binding protein [Candidatus Lokiarchaeota archaeon]MBD3341138.1 cobalamin-binding protein [Candidatus Lokiarchaeota archaeon]
MSKNEILIKLKDAIVGMEIIKAKEICEEALSQKIDPFTIIEKGIMEGITIVGDKFEAEEFFLAELLMAGEIIKQIMKILLPYIQNQDKNKPIGKVVIGTGKGDVHDIGKNVVKIFLEAEGFEVIDLGVDVSSEKFIEAIRIEKPKILAISALVSMTLPEVNNLMKEIEKANLRDELKVIIGGAPVTEDFVKDIGADAYAKNAIDGINTCLRWIRE